MNEALGGTSVYLVGMMGCGKSTVGKLLSAALGYHFFDSDTLVRLVYTNRRSGSVSVMALAAVGRRRRAWATTSLTLTPC